MTTRQKKPKATPVVHLKKQNLVSIQLRYKERDNAGRLVFTRSKGITVTGITLEDAYDRIIEAIGGGK